MRPPCVHHWLCGQPERFGVVKAICKGCGKRRTFKPEVAERPYGRTYGTLHHVRVRTRRSRDLEYPYLGREC